MPASQPKRSPCRAAIHGRTDFLRRDDRIVRIQDFMAAVNVALAEVKDAITEADTLNRWEFVPGHVKDAAIEIAEACFGTALNRLEQTIRNHRRDPNR